MPAETIAKALGGRKAGGGWMARCPAHEDRQPSLSITDTDDGKVLVHCFGGCNQGQVIAALRWHGLWEEVGRSRYRFRPIAPRAVAGAHSNREDSMRSAAALAIWNSATPAGGTLVDIYFASRGLRLPPSSPLRFHPHLKHPSGGFWPAMLALVARGLDGVPVAVHRTFLACNGDGKAPVTPERMMLGPCRGGAVQLAPASKTLMVGEGIETSCAAMLATGSPAWAALSTSGLRALLLPGTVREVIVLADGDDAGEAAALSCARRWHREGRRVRIARSPRGSDFNDLLCGHGQDIARELSLMTSQARSA